MKNMNALRLTGRGAAVLIAAVFFAAGCSRQVARLDERDFHDPLLRKAQSRIRQGDKDGAVASLHKALERKPELAQAHLELALLYDDYKKDYVGAIYHYQRYLERRPETQKRRLIEDLIRKAKMSFAASVSDQFPEAEKKLLALEEENRRLKISLREVRENMAKLLAGGEKPPVASASRPPVKNQPGGQFPPSAADSTVYYVQEGDTLSLIAARFYRNPRKWNVIFEANRAQLPTPERLRNGQALIIPALVPPAGGNPAGAVP